MRTMLYRTVLVLAFSLVHFASCSFFDTCLDLAKKRYKVNNGTRVFKPPRSNVAVHLVYCQFLTGYGYTFISTTSFTNTDIYRYNADSSDFKVVFLSKTGSQYETVISPGNDDEVISAYYNKKPADDDDLVINKDMYPFVTYSLSNENHTYLRNTLSYVANGETIEASSCLDKLPDESGTFVWSFLFNHENNPPLDDKNRSSESAYLKAWIKSATPASVSLPRNFFAFFEMRYTSCDEYISGDDFGEIIGAAVGIKFVVECPEPERLSNGYYSLTGYRFMDNVTYFCNQGYEMFDEQILTCNEKGKWIGELPYCKEIKPRFCSDILAQYSVTLPGEYLIYSKHNTPNIVYCEFWEDHVITFLHPNGLLGIKLDDLYNDGSKVLIRARYSDGQQVESLLSQTNSNIDVPIKISLSYSKTIAVTFRAPMDNQNEESQNISIGYNINGEDVEMTLQHCCHDESESEVQFAVFLGDDVRSRHNVDRLEASPIETKWLTEARPLPGEMYMPQSLYSDFSMRVGHDPVHHSLLSDTGIAIGVISNL